jgi:spore germination protein Q
MPMQSPWLTSPSQGVPMPMGGSPYGGAAYDGAPYDGAPYGYGQTGQMPGGAVGGPSGGVAGPGAGAGAGAPGTEESYIENILRYNRGKIATFHLTYEGNSQWNAQTVRGRIETAGRDHIIVSDPSTGKRYLLLMMNLDWVEFDEPVAYIPPKLPAGAESELVNRPYER